MTDHFEAIKQVTIITKDPDEIISRNKGTFSTVSTIDEILR